MKIIDIPIHLRKYKENMIVAQIRRPSLWQCCTTSDIDASLFSSESTSCFFLLSLLASERLFSFLFLLRTKNAQARKESRLNGVRSESRYTQYNIGQIHQFIGYDCAESYFYYETCFYIYIIFRIYIVLSLNMLYIKKSYKHFIVYNMKK